jgi:hypothetical protein
LWVRAPRMTISAAAIRRVDFKGSGEETLYCSAPREK